MSASSPLAIVRISQGNKSPSGDQFNLGLTWTSRMKLKIFALDGLKRPNTVLTH